MKNILYDEISWALCLSILSIVCHFWKSNNEISLQYELHVSNILYIFFVVVNSYDSQLSTWLRNHVLHMILEDKQWWDLPEFSWQLSQHMTGIYSESLTSIPEGGSHNNSLVTKLLIVVVDLSNTLHTRIIFRFKGFLISVCHIPGYKRLHAVNYKVHNNAEHSC